MSSDSSYIKSVDCRPAINIALLKECEMLDRSARYKHDTPYGVKTSEAGYQ